MFQLTQLDCNQWLKDMPNESVDLVVTDPGYESLEKWRAIGSTTRLKKSWFPVVPNSYFVPFFTELYRVLKPNTHAYVFCDAETMFAIKPMGEAAGFKFWKPLVFDKKSIGMGYHYRCRYELILFFEKGKRRLNDLGIADILECPRIVNGYPTEKPVPILKTLVEQSSQPGELVIDPFMGSGATGVAALHVGRQFLGNDISENSIKLANTRLIVADGGFVHV